MYIVTLIARFLNFEVDLPNGVTSLTFYFRLQMLMLIVSGSVYPGQLQIRD